MEQHNEGDRPGPYGSSDVLQLTEIDRPVVKDGQVMVRPT